MNILFVLYGGIETNSFLCLSRFAKELGQRGHSCAAVLLNGAIGPWKEKYLQILTANEVLKNPNNCFGNGQRASVIHAWTPRQNVCHFVSSYRGQYPTPLFVYSEDDEVWIASEWLAARTRLQKILAFFNKEKIPPYFSDPVQAHDFLKMADMAGIITPVLKKDLPPGLPFEVLLPGVDLKEFVPQVTKPLLREKFHLDNGEKLIVYCGGINQFTAPSMRDLCHMVLLLNQRGHQCRLVRTGVQKVSHISGIKKESLEFVLDLGLVPSSEIPMMMSLADVFVQPGRPSSFEAGRFPCKTVEFMAMGVPSILPNCNAGQFVKEGEEALTHSIGTPEELAVLCEKVFNDPLLQIKLSEGARRFAERHFDIQKNTDQLEMLYQKASVEFSKKQR